MAFDSLGRYTPNWKSWDHIGNVIPQVEHSEGFRPQGEFRPAAWLPTVFFDKFYEDYFVMMPGKIIACDNDGRLVPAQYGLSGASITYTTTDVAAGVIDVRTGVALLTANVGTFNVSAVSSFMGRGQGALSVGSPIAVAPYAFWQWAGDGSALDDGNNPAALRRTNYELQHRVAILCDYVIELPLVPAQVAAEVMASGVLTKSGLVTFAALSNLPVADNTVRTPITFTGTGASTTFVNQVTASGVNGSTGSIAFAGDWAINGTTGVITAYGTAAVASGTFSVTYYTYASTVTPGAFSAFTCAYGNLKAGDFVKCDSNSNWTKATISGLGSVSPGDGFDVIMGQVIEVENIFNKDALGLVRTAWANLTTSAAGSVYAGALQSNPNAAGYMDQMPGSANGGVTDKVAYAGAADLVVRINLISR
jgi:hypothetical protein